MGMFWRIAYRNLFRNGRRNLLTGTSIGLGLVGISLLGGYILRMERYLATQSVYLTQNGHVIVYAEKGLDHHLSEPSRYSLSGATLSHLQAFAQDERVDKTAPLLKATGLIHNGCVSFPYSAVAAEPQATAWARSRPEVNRYVRELATVERGKGFWEASPDLNPVNISPRLAGILGKNKVAGEEGAHTLSEILDCSLPEAKRKLASDPSVQLLGLGFEGGMALSDGTLTGHVSSGMAFQDDTALFLPYGMAQVMYGTEKATAFTYYLKKESQIPGFIQDLKASLASNGLKADVYPFFDEEISAFYVGGMQFNWVMLYLFLALVCSVVAISISNSLYISLMERKAELGTLRSIGFRQGEIANLLLLESSFLLVMSFLPALLVTFLVKAAVNSANIRLTIPGLAGDIQFRLYLTWGYIAVVMVLLSALVLVVTRVGAAKFLRRNILDLLGTSSC